MDDDRQITTLIGIARRTAPKAPMETLTESRITFAGGVLGDTRGKRRTGRKNDRQITLIREEDWKAACAEIGIPLPWHLRRANLLVTGHLPRDPGGLIVIGEVALEITGECDPCRRMDAIHPGLEAALRPDWRGGRCARVVEGGHVRLGDRIVRMPEGPRGW